ncbi:MAG: cyclase family protein [Methanolobus sp.]
MKGRIIDITTGISESTPVYDGDPKPVIEKVSSLEEDGYIVSRISIGTHTGTHVDAPCHIFKGGKTIDAILPESLMGKAILLDLSKGSGEIKASDLDAAWKKFSDEKDVDVLLIKALDSSFSPDAALSSGRALAADAGEWILDSGFTVVGVDLLSVDAEESLPNHHLFLEKEIIIVEYLHLSEVVEDVYYFICLPLKIMNIDGAPARAILIESPFSECL